MDMRQATGEAGVPTNITQNSGATQNGPRVRDRDLSKIFHALLMCATFVILFPVGAIFMRIFGSVRMHRLTQIFSVMVILIGLGLGIKLSKQYNKVIHHIPYPLIYFLKKKNKLTIYHPVQEIPFSPSNHRSSGHKSLHLPSNTRIDPTPYVPKIPTQNPIKSHPPHRRPIHHPSRDSQRWNVRLFPPLRSHIPKPSPLT